MTQSIEQRCVEALEKIYTVVDPETCLKRQLDIIVYLRSGASLVDKSRRSEDHGNDRSERLARVEGILLSLGDELTKLLRDKETLSQ